jgi:hypothetical protein
MRPDELAEELADFWLSAIARVGWEERLKILREIDAQLLADLEKRSEHEVVSPRFVAAVIRRLGAPNVTSEAQARIYTSSADVHHLDAARLWFQQAAGSPGQADLPHPGRERRRFPREKVDATSEIWIHGQAAPCHLVDLSRGGARVTVQGMDAIPGMNVQLALPDSGLRNATVVFQSELGVGLQFFGQPMAA